MSYGTRDILFGKSDFPHFFLWFKTFWLVWFGSVTEFFIFPLRSRLVKFCPSFRVVKMCFGFCPLGCSCHVLSVSSNARPLLSSVIGILLFSQRCPRSQSDGIHFSHSVTQKTVFYVPSPSLSVSLLFLVPRLSVTQTQIVWSFLCRPIVSLS